MTFEELRARAERAIRLTRNDVAALATHDAQRLVHELQVHQIELEMQNDALRGNQRELEEAKTQYQTLFDCAPVGYIIVDAGQAIVRANASALALLGMPWSALRRRCFADFVSRRDAARLREHMLGAKTAITSCEVTLVTPRDRALHVRLDLGVVPSGDSNCLIVVTDISERRRALDDSERLNQQLAARALEVEARNRQLEGEIARRAEAEAQRHALETRLREAKRLESLGLLAAGIAHDFNNLLVSVLGNAEILLVSPGLTQTFRTPLTLIKQAGRHASELTRQLLEFAGEGQLNLTTVSLLEVIGENLALLRPRLPAGVRLDIEPGPELPAITADRGQLNQAVMNLVTNAIEAVGGSGSVTLRTREESLTSDILTSFRHHSGVEPGRFVIVEVQDDGPGMDPETVARIFEPFFSTKRAGRGLGLASVLGIVQSHGGALRVQAGPARGTRFEMALPVPKHTPDAAPARTAPEPTWAGSGRVLLIDDDPTVREVVARLLEHLGFEVVEADGGASGLEALRCADPAFKFVVLDWIMPGFSGELVLEALRVLEPKLPVIVLSGHCQGDSVTQDARVINVQKPATLVQLQDAAQRALTLPVHTVH